MHANCKSRMRAETLMLQDYRAGIRVRNSRPKIRIIFLVRVSVRVCNGV